MVANVANKLSWERYLEKKNTLTFTGRAKTLVVFYQIVYIAKKTKHNLKYYHDTFVEQQLRPVQLKSEVDVLRSYCGVNHHWWRHLLRPSNLLFQFVLCLALGKICSIIISSGRKQIFIWKYYMFKFATNV